MKYRAITTCNAAGWSETGRRMAESFVRHWRDVDLTVYAEGFDPDVSGVRVGSLPEWLGEFKRRHGGAPEANGRGTGQYDFRRDCVRFSHKVAAIDAAAARIDGVLVWMDADTLTHADVDRAWLDSLFDSHGYIAWLNRDNKYPECGFLMFDTEHPAHAVVMSRLRHLYTSGGVFALPETHDSFVIEHVIKGAVAEGLIEPPTPLSRPGYTKGHVFLASRLSERMDHAKGARKRAGRSPARERPVKDDNPYWKLNG